MIAEVVFKLPLDRSFHYLVPIEWQDRLRPGMRVEAPFSGRTRVGFVVKLLGTSEVERLKPLRRLLDLAPVVADERWGLASWLATYYYCSPGEAFAAMVPAALRLKDADTEADDEAARAVAPVAPEHLKLTARQREAFNEIAAALTAAQPATILLHGVTGSGKTELYLQAIDAALGQGRSAICLVPEIALTPQAIDRFTARFGARAVVWHSRLTPRERMLAWQQLASGVCRVVVGTRSAVFAPVVKLGLIILDEEHERTYKQGETPRYHARDVAQMRAKLCGALVLLGSATPSVETYYRAQQGHYRLVTLPERVQGRRLPSVEIVDLRQGFGGRGGSGPLSARMRHVLDEVVARGQQAMLLLNRRGFARYAQCHTCGTVVRCRDCSVPLIYHASQRLLICHSCNFREEPPELCEQCRKGYLRFRGAGTERVESELHRLFPAASISRMDSDTMRRRESHRELYDALREGSVGLLVGTQMMAKGFDFPEVTLVGVVSADTALNLPDFRAGEWTFSLLTQAAGRAGRGATPGRVIIQTYCPPHYAIQSAARHDYPAFFTQEMQMRRRHRLPPFTHLIELTLRGARQARVQAAADTLVATMRPQAARRAIVLLGPAPHRIPWMRKIYRMRVLMKGEAVAPMVALLRDTLRAGRTYEGVPVTVDVDPL